MCYNAYTYIQKMKYEIEVKALIGKKARAEELISKMKQLDPEMKTLSQSKQLNHYFEGDDTLLLYEKTESLFDEKATEQMREIIEKGNSLTVRSRQNDDEVFLVIKASIDKGTSDHAISRLEFEEPVKITMDELDRVILDSGYVYQAKWSRKRTQYSYKGTTACLDKNAGYGYLFEFEKIVNYKKDITKSKEDILRLMEELGVQELPQDRLERMFAYYNSNWHRYYGTNKTFLVA